MVQSDFVSKGSVFCMADLHIHTPASKCYEEKGVTAEDIVNKALEKGLKIIAITDHNDVAFVDNVRNAARGRDLHVFPGVEITAEGGHIIAIFDKDYPLNSLNDLLARAGIDSEKRGKKDAIAKNVENVLVEIIKAGGIPIASHANSSNGILQHAQGIVKTKNYKDANLKAVEFTDRDDVEKFSRGKVVGYPARACLQASDSHKLAEIGQRYVCLKMDEVSLEGIKQALLDHEVKVRYAWDTITYQYPLMKSVKVNQGFFEGETFYFHPNLNCLIGGKGTGKSTIIELMRYCFNDISDFPDIRADTLGKVEKLLRAGGTVTVTYVDENNHELIIQREVMADNLVDANRPIVKSSTGVDAFLLSYPIFFSQGEITRIATSPIAQLELIDRYLDLSNENEQEKRCIDEIHSNSYKIAEAQNKSETLTSDIQSNETGKLATKQKYEQLEKTLRDPILIDFPKWDSEERYLNGILKGLDTLKSKIEELLDEIDLESISPNCDITSPNYDLLKPLAKIPSLLKQDMESAKDALIKKITERKKMVEDIFEKWKPLFEDKKREYEKFIEENLGADAREAQSRLRALKLRLDDLGKKETVLQNLSKEATESKTSMSNAVKLFKDTRLRRYRKRDDIAKRWTRDFEGTIKIDIVQDGDRKRYFERLASLLTRSKIRDTDIGIIVDKVYPEDLVEAVLNDRVSLLVDQTGIKEKTIKKLVEFLSRGQKELYDLQAVELRDIPKIEFQVEKGRYKLIDELSVGQKGTVIISLAMIEGNSPLIIDQPEESLDTLFIYNQVVKKLREGKEKRQFIFATHNPNILIASDADLSHVLDATADKGTIKSAGGIDKPDTNQLLLVHLEGGEDAFRLRASKYIKIN